MKKSIILEGPNGAGKSTLGEMLQKVLGLPYEHAGPSPGDSMNAFRACRDQYARLEEGVILDRCTPLSRLVYETNAPEGELEWLPLWFKLMEEKAHVIFCTGEGVFTEKEYYPEGHYEEIVKNRENIRKRYRHIVGEMSGPIEYNWATDSIDGLLARIRSTE